MESRNTDFVSPVIRPSHIQYAISEAYGRADPRGGSGKRPGGVALSRTASMSSEMSVRPGSSRSVDPGMALPPMYRTLSIRLDASAQEEGARVEAEKDEIADELSQLEWHKLNPSDLYSRLDTNPSTGLTTDQVQTRLAQYGKNVPSPPPSTLLKRLFIYCFGGFGSLLLVGGILCIVAWKPLGEPNPQAANAALGIVLLLVFVIQAGFNAWQDWSSSRVMASINTMLPDFCLVLRQGEQVEVSATELVPGDIVYVKLGNKIPADLRIVEASADLKFDRSILTGESKPLPGTVESSHDNYLETRCIAMQGTHCVSGTAVGACVGTADETVFGRIAKLSSQPRKGLTTLQKEILRFITIIVSLVAFFVTLVCILWAAWLRKEHEGWISVPMLIVSCVSVAVAFIPEGLPIALTTCLTITAAVMKKNKILCKSLATVETLGSVTLICSDKTGTLTKNEMHVTDFAIFSECFTTESLGDKPVATPPMLKLHAIAGRCNAAEFDATTQDLPPRERRVHGNATDAAILRFAEIFGSVKDLRFKLKKVVEIPFNSKSKFMVTLAESGPTEEKDESNDYILMAKGAPDILIQRCAEVTLPNGSAEELTEESKKIMQEIQSRWALEGKRVLLLAQRAIPKSDYSTQDVRSPEFADEVLASARNLTLMGLVGIVDPPRPEIPGVIRVLRRAGVKVFMVTGDFKLTAQAIARECGILTVSRPLIADVSALQRDFQRTEGSAQSTLRPNHLTDLPSRAIVLEGPELLKLNENQWKHLTEYNEIIFARTTPEQKLQIVQHFQRSGEIVGMTGDGVNDAPGLKAADIGIALGSGSDIAIEAADMVLLDSFAAIVDAVASGRLVFDNLRKTIAYLLPAGSFSELWPVMINVLFGLPQNLSSFLMIIICCFTDCAGAMTLAYEKPEADIMTRPPRNIHSDHLVDGQLILHAYGFIGILECGSSMAISFWHMERRGLPFGALWLKYGNINSKLYPEDFVTRVVNEASSIYFVNLVVMQLFNLLAVRTRRLSIFQQPPIFNHRTQNLHLFPAMIFALSTIFFFCYIPFFQGLLGTTTVSVEYFFLPVAFGIGILMLDEARKWAVRKGNVVLKQMAW